MQPAGRAAHALGVAAALAVAAVPLTAVAAGEQRSPGPMHVTASGHERRTLYHSPQTPGYTCWAGIWPLPDGSCMVTCTQVTGSTAGWRPRAPAALLRRMPSATRNIAGYDMTGMVQENVYLRSGDGGKTWQKTGSEPFCSCMNGMWGGGLIVLADGALLRDVWGQALPYWDVPQSGFLQRSTDEARSWGPPEPLTQDPGLQTWPKRLRRLRDGRILLTGATSPYEPDRWTWDAQLPRIRPCLWVSRDATGTCWSGPLYLAPEDRTAAGEEWDVAELPAGDLLAVLRVAAFDADGKTVRQERRQCRLTKREGTWEPGPLAAAPFPHSGQPELLAAREGGVLHIAANGVWWTGDGGTNWTKLDLPGSAYYPSALQLADGTILVVSHIGSDDPFGRVDQSVVLDSFRLVVEP